MILTQTVTYRGKPKPVFDLGRTSGYRVMVLCPLCGNVRTVHHSSIMRARHCICQPCMVRLVTSKSIESGRKFSRLTVAEPHESTGKSVCRCICGNITVVNNYDLKSGGTKSCGCLKKESFKNARKVRASEHGRWKGGVSARRHRDMATSRYKTWRTSVFERDNYTCQACGQWGYSLNAHHIYNYSDHPHVRYDIDNGATLCKQCHTEFHSVYGRKDINQEQLDEFVASKGESR